MAQRNAFLDPTTGVLKCHGYVETNELDDIKIPVPDEFDKKPGQWVSPKKDGTDWKTV